MEYLVVALMIIVFLQTRFMELRRSTLLLAVQSALIAATCLVVGIAHGGGLHGFMPGILTIVVKVICIPYAILRVVKDLKDEKEIVSDINVNYSTAVAAAALKIASQKRAFDSETTPLTKEQKSSNKGSRRVRLIDTYECPDCGCLHRKERASTTQLFKLGLFTSGTFGAIASQSSGSRGGSGLSGGVSSGRSSGSYRSSSRSSHSWGSSGGGHFGGGGAGGRF